MTASKEIVVFVEDEAHAKFIKALLERIAEEHDIELNIPLRPAPTGGAGKALTDLRQFLRDMQADDEFLPDLILIMIDSNCTAHTEKRREIERRIQEFPQYQTGFVVVAIPDPHIERWLLLDSEAFKKVFGRGCRAPGKKCNRNRYKQWLTDEIREAGIEPLFGGIEYTEEIVREMDLQRMKDSGETLGRTITELESRFQQWVGNSPRNNDVAC